MQPATDAPDCLTLGGTISAIDIDESLIRIGSSDGLVASGEFGRGWRLEWLLGTAITSIRTCPDRFVATSFGPNAAAIFASSAEAASLASITLRPRKTSIWTSSLSSNLLVLGCDDGVMCANDPTKARMDTIQLGSAVYAIEQLNEGRTVIAGTRSGAVTQLDVRSPQKTTLLETHAAVTHLRQVDTFGLIVASMDGKLVLHDQRNMPAALLTYGGHVNKTQRELGLDAGHGLLAAAGQDCRVRLWDLARGTAIEPNAVRPPYAPERNGLLNTVYEEPIAALAFQTDTPSLLVANGAELERHELAWTM